MKARFASTCHACSAGIDEGSDIFYLPDIKKAKHQKCQPAKPPPTRPVKKSKTKQKPQDILTPSIPVIPTDWRVVYQFFKDHNLDQFDDASILKIIKCGRDGEPPF